MTAREKEGIDMSKIKLIAIDLDGTLLSPEMTISERTKNLIKRLQNDGYIVLIATGRIFSSATAVAKNLGLDMPLIACNGAETYDSINDKYYKELFPEELSRKVIDICQEAGIYHHFYTEDTIYATELINTAKRFDQSKDNAQNKHVKAVKIVKDLNTVIANNEIYKFGIFQDGTYDFDTVRAKFDEHPDLDTVFSNVGLCDIMKKNISKWSAVKKLLEVYNISPAEAIAFGDSPNDCELIKNVAHGVAMANAHPKVKAVANDETLSNAEDGVYHYLKKYIYNE